MENNMSKKVQWHYHRNGCISCKRALDFMNQHDIKASETVSSNKKLQSKDAAALAAQASKVIIAKGNKVTEFNMKESTPDDVSEHMLGPTGNLRAPTLVVGKTLLVGFNQDVYTRILG